MTKKILRFVAYLIFVQLPFAPVIENFFPRVDPSNFWGYLGAGFLLVLVMILFAFMLRGTVHPERDAMQFPAWLFFSIGAVALFPLHLGPPRETPELLQALAIERFRYLMLLLAVLIFAVANYKTLTLLQLNGGITGKILTALLLVVTLANLWDNYDSLTFGSQLKAWIAQGNPAETFFPSYDFHETARALSRLSLYLVSGSMCLVLWKRGIIGSLQAGSIAAFCILGVSFCVLCIINGQAYYFPFMVPAIAMAPAYWTGLILLGERKTTQIKAAAI